MEPKEWIPLIIQALLAIGTLAGAWPLIKRVGTQNSKDKIDATKVALEIAGIDLSDQLEMKKEVRHLKDLLERRRYKISVIFRLGENPVVEEASIESYEVPSSSV